MLRYCSKLAVPLHIFAWALFGFIFGAEAIFFAEGKQSVVIVLLAVMNYALITCVWAIGYGMGAYQNRPEDDKTDC